MEKEDDVVIRDDRIVGCRGRVLVVVLVLSLLILVMIAILFYSLFAGEMQQPVRRASAEPNAATLAAAPHGVLIRDPAIRRASAG